MPQISRAVGSLVTKGVGWICFVYARHGREHMG